MAAGPTEEQIDKVDYEVGAQMGWQGMGVACLRE
jgi:hypothetical protein